ncbi:MAG TPA: hypothetical protein VKT77_12620 [Chthonomonadaceae bacterium]|nr:hypothetical protein [Chthonomonadaceae bacterium]
MNGPTGIVPMAMLRISSYRNLANCEGSLVDQLPAINAQAVAAHLTRFFGGSLHFGQYRSNSDTYRDAELFFPYSLHRFAELASLLPERCITGWSVDASVAYVGSSLEHTEEWFRIGKTLNPAPGGSSAVSMFRGEAPDTIEWVEGCADEYEDRPARQFTRADAERFDTCTAALLRLAGEERVKIVDYRGPAFSAPLRT